MTEAARVRTGLAAFAAFLACVPLANWLILNVGTRGGVRTGDTLKVTRPGREIKDPATGKVLRRVESDLGTIKITSADDSSSEGTYSGQPGVKVGDRVKN